MTIKTRILVRLERSRSYAFTYDGFNYNQIEWALYKLLNV